jgi:hypothetical protein
MDEEPRVTRSDIHYCPWACVKGEASSQPDPSAPARLPPTTPCMGTPYLFRLEVCQRPLLDHTNFAHAAAGLCPFTNTHTLAKTATANG